MVFRAGRLMLEEMNKHLRLGNSFAFETTLSGRYYASQIPRWRSDDYRVKLFYLQLPSAAMAVSKVDQRVATGGHNVSESVF